MILKIYFPQTFDKLIDSIVLHSVTDLSNPLICLGFILKVHSLRRGGGCHWKANRGRSGEVLACVYFRFLKKMLRFSKSSFIVILQLFLLIIMAVWNIKQSIMKEDNIQSCHWMVCDCFHEPLLLCTTFCSFICTIHYFFVHFQQKWLLIHWL